VDADIGIDRLLPFELALIKPFGVAIALLKEGEPGTPAAPHAPGGGDGEVRDCPLKSRLAVLELPFVIPDPTGFRVVDMRLSSLVIWSVVGDGTVYDAGWDVGGCCGATGGMFSYICDIRCIDAGVGGTGWFSRACKLAPVNVIPSDPGFCDDALLDEFGFDVVKASGDGRSVGVCIR
jgi:hypothetical protein